MPEISKIKIVIDEYSIKDAETQGILNALLSSKDTSEDDE